MDGERILVEDPMACCRLTRVHDKYYDLKDFEHPGGQLALACAYQRDATELFHSYHQFKDRKKILEILKKYEVSIEEKNIGLLIAKKSLFNWEETLASPFYREIRQSLDPYFAKNGTKMNSERVCEVLFLFFVALSQYFFLLRGRLFSLFTFAISLFIFVANLAHDASHFAVSERPWVNELACELIVFVTPKYYWMNQHVIGHHCYTNVPNVDPDISVLSIVIILMSLIVLSTLINLTSHSSCLLFVSRSSISFLSGDVSRVRSS
jgi:hypothetical protein